MLSDCCLTIKGVIEQVPISFGFCTAILKDYLDLQRVTSPAVAKTLNFFQKQRRVQVAQEINSQVDSSVFTTFSS